ncbi:MAG: IS110 family transposase, partial [Planctomycetes bacterium]|nr:IS110 family transposase [Planctomycetota bacterium]
MNVDDERPGLKTDPHNGVANPFRAWSGSAANADNGGDVRLPPSIDPAGQSMQRFQRSWPEPLVIDGGIMSQARNPQPRRTRKASPPPRAPFDETLSKIHSHAAGIDIGASEHWVCIDPRLDAKSTRRFGAFTEDLDQLVSWLLERQITTVAMEATGIYWRSLYLKLSEAGIEAVLVDPRQTRNPRGRKTDMLDCQWIWQLHAHGLISGGFVPPEQMHALRQIMRLRCKRVKEIGVSLVEMQRALSAMNFKLQHVIADVGGKTGLAIIDAILAGTRDPRELARLRDYRCREDEKTIAKAMTGTWREECLFELAQARKDYQHFKDSIADCDTEIARRLETLLPKPSYE